MDQVNRSGGGSWSSPRRIGRGSGFVVLGTAAVSIGIAMGGCAGTHPLETGYSDQGKMQVQFYAPEGATATVREGCPTPRRSHQIATYGPFEHRLEHSPEEFSVFNLSPGRHEFKYVSASGLPGVSLYGELEVRSPWTAEGRTFMRRSFVPIRLPAVYYDRPAAEGDAIFPYIGEAYRAAIDEADIMRLKQGDVVEKVFFVADLEKAAKRVDELRKRLVVLDRELEYAETRYKYAYTDFRMLADDPLSQLVGADRSYIGWEGKRQDLMVKLEKTEAELKRNQALLKGDRVLIRRGMLALATAGVVPPHRDAVESASRMGEVLLVMRVGGRHMHWGTPNRELAAYEP